jgi:hypothetical protein
MSASVMTMKKNWDADAEDDGIVVFPSLKDAAGETVKWSGATLPVDIEIWTTEMDANYKDQKDQLVYKGSGTIDSWEDGNFLLGQGIRVPFEQMKVPSGETMGWVYAKVHTPDGKIYEGVEKLASITP